MLTFGLVAGALLSLLALAGLLLAHRPAAPLTAPAGYPTSAAPPPPAASLEVAPAVGRHVVAIDPGHGGDDPGTIAYAANGTLLREKDLSLDVALRAATLLRRAGYQVALTREQDGAVNAEGQDLNGDGRVDGADDLQARVDRANAAGAEALVSIHFNGFSDPSVRGTEVFYNRDREFAAENQRLATLVADTLYAALYADGHRDLVFRGATPDTAGLGEDHYFLLGAPSFGRIARSTTMPSAIAEPLYLTNPDDVAVARSSGVADMLAGAFAAAVSHFFLAPAAAPTAETITGARPATSAGSAEVAAGSACLNLREGPRLGAPVVDCLADGSQVTLTSEVIEGDGHTWRHIEGRGWAAEDYLRPISTGP
jgi:N-acetylmuramoyl-L-alanine amidase